ncbi:MAG: hypothetical protein ACKO4S_00250 [Snowella sp.]
MFVWGIEQTFCLYGVLGRQDACTTKNWRDRIKGIFYIIILINGLTQKIGERK